MVASVHLVCLGFSGCSTNSSGGNGGGGGVIVDPYANITGNWQIDATPSGAATPFTALSGNLYEINVNAVAHQTTAALLVQSTGCFADAGTVPLKGNVEQPKLSLTSFNVNGQILTLSATKDKAGKTFSGTYSIKGGCADGNTGTITGTKYSDLTGTFGGALAGDSTKTVKLSLAQAALGTSGGTSLLTGSGTFTGFPCLTQERVEIGDSSHVSGSSVSLLLTAPGSSSTQVILLGTFLPDASSIDLASIQISGGSCAGTYGSLTLAKQS